jgi:hypothetical protein
MGRIDLDLAAQPRDAQVDRAIKRVGLAMRGDLQQPVAHQWPVRVLGKNLQQIELARGQPFLAAIIRVDQYSALEIEHPPADAHAPAGSRHPHGPPQHTLDPRQELARLEWLGYVIVGAGLQPDHAIDGIGGSGHHDDADAGAFLAQPTRQSEPILARQPDIEHNERRQFALDKPAQGGAVGESADPEILA